MSEPVGWTKFVKSYAQEYNLTYQQAMLAAREPYQHYKQECQQQAVKVRQPSKLKHQIDVDDKPAKKPKPKAKPKKKQVDSDSSGDDVIVRPRKKSKQVVYLEESSDESSSEDDYVIVPKRTKKKKIIRY